MALFNWLFGRGNESIAVIDVATANERVRKKTLVLVDVRTPGEWQAGIAKGAHPVSLGDACMVDKIHTLAGEDTSRPVAVICRTGMRSKQAAKQLSAAGFTDVSNVRGGMMAWMSANLPTKLYRGK